jgi:predicted 3-demethylubiquinone-9 3-methyltransferase (glyoxalase superfamily)
MPKYYANQFGSLLPPKSAAAPPVFDNSETIAMLQEWAREDATDDPAAIAHAEFELAEFKAALNANRPPEKPVFP